MGIVKTLTPIFIGTGRTIEAPSFQEKGKYLYCYNFEDLLTTIPTEVLMDPRNLKELMKQKASRNTYNRIFYKNIDYSKFKPLYKVAWNQDFRFSDDGLDIGEQYKDFDNPYIPGSSLKGAIENAFEYYFLKKYLGNNEKFTQKVKEYLPKCKDGLKSGTLFHLLFGIPEQEADEFCKKMYSCLLVSDIYFKDLAVYEATRSTIKQDIPLAFYECIERNKMSQNQTIFEIDQYKMNCLIKSDLVNESKCEKGFKAIYQMFTKEYLLKMINNFTYDVLKAEKDDSYELYEEVDYRINDWIPDMIRKIREVNKSNNQAILRIGKGNGYFYKTLSYLFKSKLPDFFENENNFYSIFSPVSRKSRNKPKPKTMPDSKVILKDSSGSYLAGFIQIEL